MPRKLLGLHLDEFSLVTDDEFRPVNQEAVTAFYKAEIKKENSMAKDNAAPDRKSTRLNSSHHG
jgi:hypothetical protein